MSAKRIISAIVATGILAALYAYGLIDLRVIARAFRTDPGFVIAGTVCMIVASFIAVTRQKLALSLLNVPVSWRGAASATLVSQGIGALLPASAATSEAIRIGLLLGGDRTLRETMAHNTAVASIVDRMMGVGVMFALGALAAASLCFGAHASNPLVLGLLAVANGCIGLALLLAPLAASAPAFKALLAALHGAQGARAHKLAGKVLPALDNLVEASELFKSRPGGLMRIAALGLVVVLLTTTPSFLATRAVGADVPFQLLLAAQPVTIIGILLPTGLAGYGGPQLITALVFAPLGVPPAMMVNASLIQNTLVTAVQTLLAVVVVLVDAAFPRRLIASTNQG